MKALDEVGKSWDRVYDSFHAGSPPRKSVWNERPTPFFVRLMDFLKYEGVRSVMDAGCGDGRNSEPLAEAGFHVTGVDASESALVSCRSRFAGRKNVKLVRSLLEDLPFPAGSFDAVICDHVLTHVEDVDRVLGNFLRILRKGGYALMEFTSPQDSTYGKGERISGREFLQEGVYLRYDTLDVVFEMMRRFRILCFTSENSTDPPHGPGYIRRARHRHHSYFVVARKE
jgi:SAM-dependent methyltransferase